MTLKERVLKLQAANDKIFKHACELEEWGDKFHMLARMTVITEKIHNLLRSDDDGK